MSLNCGNCAQDYYTKNQSYDNLIDVQKSVPTKNNRWKKREKFGVNPALPATAIGVESLSDRNRADRQPVLLSLASCQLSTAI